MFFCSQEESKLVVVRWHRYLSKDPGSSATARVHIAAASGALFRKDRSCLRAPLHLA